MLSVYGSNIIFILSRCYKQIMSDIYEFPGLGEMAVARVEYNSKS